MKLAGEELKDNDPRWAVHLLGKIRDSGLMAGSDKDLNDLMAQGIRRVAADVFNTNILLKTRGLYFSGANRVIDAAGFPFGKYDC